MKIMHVIIGLNVGGAEMMLKRLVVSHHGAANFQHVVVSLMDIGKIGMELKSKGVRVHALNLKSALHLPLILWRLVRLIRREEPEIVQTWMYHADLVGGIAARIAGVRTVIWGIRTTDIRAGKTTATVLVRWFCARLSRWIPVAIVCAAEASRRSHAAIGYDANKLEVLPNGYDFSLLRASPDERKDLRAQHDILPNEIVVGSLGRFHEVKHQENFIRAAGVIAPKFPHVKFLMVGRGLDWDNKQLVDWIACTGFEDRFVLLGERTDVPQCLSAMDIFCLHSRNEGFPNVLAEAMAMGLPCVTTDVGDAAVLLDKMGVIVPKEDATALAAGIERLLSYGQEDRIALGAQARIRVETVYSISRARERFEDLYRRVQNEGRN